MMHGTDGRLGELATLVEQLQAAKARALELAEYIDDKARALDDFGDLIAIPSQAWCELLAVLTRRADSGSQNPLTHVGQEGPEQQVRFEDDGLDSGSEAPPP